MTTIDLYEPIPERRGRHPALIAGIKRLWTSMQKRGARRRSIIELSRMDARLLRDMGIEPLDVTDALSGKRRSVWLNPMRKPADHE
jgi:uncharacterized protein YjiS (DUF1127 family)